MNVIFYCTEMLLKHPNDKGRPKWAALVIQVA